MTRTASGRTLPEGYEAPNDKLLKHLTVGDFEFKYSLNSAGQVEYSVYDYFEGTHDKHTCTVHQFEMGMAALCDDSQLLSSEYEDAELSQGPIVRWIP